jgi:hypothetical protein
MGMRVIGSCYAASSSRAIRLMITPTIEQMFGRCIERILKYVNTTVVDACLCGGQTGDPPVPPCVRENSTLCAGDSPNCDPNRNCGEEGELTDGKPQCGPWLDSELPDSPLDDDDHPIWPQAPNNSFAASDPAEYLEVGTGCGPDTIVGAKRVQAKKAWHGRAPFTAFAGESGITGDCECTWRGEQITPPYDTKYLCVSASAYGGSDVFCSFPDAHTRHSSEGSVSGSACVDSHSGHVTYECTAAAAQPAGGGYDNPTQPLALFSYVQGLNPAALIDRYCAWLGVVAAEFVRDGVDLNDYATFDCNSVTWSRSVDGVVVKSGSLSVSSTELHFARSGLPEFSETEDIVISATDASYDYVLSDLGHANTEEEDCDNSILTEHAEAHLSGEYTAAAWLADLYALSNVWNMTDDAVLPWRTDGFVTVAPMVSYDETPTTPVAQAPNNVEAYVLWLQAGSPDPAVELQCQTDSTVGKTGALKGAPLPAGYMGAWDFHHTSWAACNDCDTVVWPEARYYNALSSVESGGDLTDTVVPGNATAWTDNYEASKMWGLMNADTGVVAGWFVEYGNIYGGWGYLQKSAELRVPRPSVDCERPCGDADRRLLDESTVRCIVAYDAGTDTFTVDSPTNIPDGSRIGVFGWAGVADGFYDSHQVDPTHYQLTGDFTGSTYDGDAGTGILGLKMFSDDVPDCPDPSDPNCSGEKERGDFYFASWAHDLRDYQERDAWIAAYGDGSGGCGCADAPGDPIRQHQATWGMPRSVTAFDVSAGNILANGCGPAVMAGTPNGEAWPNGINASFPESFVPDDTYGSLWQGCVVQTMPDPFWRAPHRPCVSCDTEAGTVYGPTACGWVEDSGACAEDDAASCDCSGGDGDGFPYIPGTRYYPQRRWVEAALGCPEGCPGTPSMNVLALSDLDTAGPIPAGKVLAPPAVVGADFAFAGACPYYDVVIPPIQTATPWGIWRAEGGCVAESGRFATEYEEDRAISMAV